MLLQENGAAQLYDSRLHIEITRRLTFLIDFNYTIIEFIDDNYILDVLISSGTKKPIELSPHCIKKLKNGKRIKRHQ